MKKYLRGTPKERFLNRVNMDGSLMDSKDDRCWEWLGKGNYIYLGIPNEFSNSKTITNVRLSYALYVGEIFREGNVFRDCGNSNCVNPDHLFLGTRGSGGRIANPVIKKNGVIWKGCATCKNMFPFTWEFYYSQGKGKLQSSCKECAKKASKQRKVDNWEYYLWLEAKSSSKTRNLSFEILVDDIKDLYKNQGGKCYWFGVELLPSPIPRYPFQPSIDRLDNSNGYVKENIVLSCVVANVGRNCSSLNDWHDFLLSLDNDLANAFWRDSWNEK